MSKDYTDGYNDGYEAATGRLDREVVLLARKLALTDTVLRAAVRVLQAYGEDEGYTPSRVADEVKLLEQEGWL